MTLTEAHRALAEARRKRDSARLVLCTTKLALDAERGGGARDLLRLHQLEKAHGAQAAALRAAAGNVARLESEIARCEVDEVEKLAESRRERRSVKVDEIEKLA